MNDIEIYKLIRDRYSPRAYSTKPLSEASIFQLLEAARWAASARNSQPWRFIYATPDKKEYWDKLFDCLTEFNQEWVQSAPFLMLALVQKTDPIKNKPRSNAGYQLGLAMGNFTAQANEIGVYLRNMGGFSVEKAITNFSIPEIYEPFVMIAAGYPENENSIKEKFKVPEGIERERKPLNQLIFNGNWEKML